MAQTPVPYFFYALGILLREGMEAMLVVVALAAGVKQMGQGRRVREIYCGALLAIAASVLMAWGLAELISDDANDTMEGIFQLVAAGTLFYVSSWLTAKTQANRWREFLFSNLKESGRRALPFAMGVTAFLAVLREGAETVVFFQALLAGASKGIEQHAIWAGVSAAAAVLLIAFFTLQRFLVRIPLGAFFRATSVLFLSSSTRRAVMSSRRGCAAISGIRSRPWPATMASTVSGPGGASSRASRIRSRTVTSLRDCQESGSS